MVWEKILGFLSEPIFGSKTAATNKKQFCFGQCLHMKWDASYVVVFFCKYLLFTTMPLSLINYYLLYFFRDVENSGSGNFQSIIMPKLYIQYRQKLSTCLYFKLLLKRLNFYNITMNPSLPPYNRTKGNKILRLIISS